MKILLTGKCQCGTQFQKDTQINDITTQESGHVSLRCNVCKRLLKVDLLWEQAKVEQTIAQSLNDKLVDESKLDGSVKFSPDSREYIFSDGSKAIVITRLEGCKPYQTKSLSTSSVNQVRYWKAL